MSTKNRRKKHTENIEVTTGERDADEDDEESNKNRQLNTSKTRQNQRQRDSVTTTNDVLSSSNLAGKIFFKLISFY